LGEAEKEGGAEMRKLLAGFSACCCC